MRGAGAARWLRVVDFCLIEIFKLTLFHLPPSLRSRTATGEGVGENNKLETGGRQNAGLDNHVVSEEEQRAEVDGASTYAHSRSVL